MIAQHRRSLVAILALIWLTMLVALYYVSHKPFSPSLALRLGYGFVQVAAAFAIASVSGGLGARLISAQSLHPLSRLAIRAAVGLGLLSIGVLAAGAAGGLHPFFGWAALVLLGVLFRRQIVGWWRDWGGWLRFIREGGRLGQAIAAGAVLLLVATLNVALAPPLKFDALVYHLAIPRAYLNAGRVLYLPWNMFWGMPQTGEMLYTWVMTLAGDSAAAVLGWFFGLMAAGGLAGYLSGTVGARAAWIGLASLLAGYTLSASLAWSYVDWLAILFGVAFLVALDTWRTQKKGTWLAWSGAFAGMALGTKYTAGILIPAGLVVITWTSFQHWRQEGNALAKLQQGVSFSLGFVLPAVAVSLPWWIKNSLAAGFPFYPLLHPAGAMDALRLHLYQNSARWSNWQDVLLLPLRATLLGVEGASGYSASIGPLLLSLGPMAWLGWGNASQERRQAVSTAGLVSLAGLLVWVIAGRYSDLLLQPRLYFSLFPALAILAGAGFAALDDIRLPQLRPGRVIGALVLLVWGFAVLKIGLQTVQLGGPEFLLALDSEEEYLNKNLGWYAQAAQAIRQLPDGSRVLMLWEPRSLYCEPKCLPDEILDRWPHDLAVYQTPDAVLQSWREAGYTHLLYYRQGADFLRREEQRYPEADWQVLDSLLSHLTVLQDFGGVYTLYTLTP